jgi:hypothetical protein
MVYANHDARNTCRRNCRRCAGWRGPPRARIDRFVAAGQTWTVEASAAPKPYLADHLASTLLLAGGAAVDPAAGRLRAGRRPARAQGPGTGARAHRRPETQQPAPDRRRGGAQAHRKSAAGKRAALPPAGGDVVRLVLGTGRAAALRRRDRPLHRKIRHRRRAHPRQDALGIRGRPGRQRNRTRAHRRHRSARTLQEPGIPRARRPRRGALVLRQRPADVRRRRPLHRLPRHRQRHHGAQDHRAARAPRGPARRADRPAQPFAAAGPPRPGRGLRHPQRPSGMGDADRPGPLQVRQRQHGPQGRRRAPDDGGGAPALLAARHRHRGAPVGRRIRGDPVAARRPAAVRRHRAARDGFGGPGR